MRRLRASAIGALAALALLAAPAGAEAAFGLSEVEASFADQDESPAALAGSHPFASTFYLEANTEELPEGGGTVPVDAIKDVVIEQPQGFVGNPAAVPSCAPAVFLASVGDPSVRCPDESVLGRTTVEIAIPGEFQTNPVYRLPRAPGTVLKLGFDVRGVPIVIDVGLSQTYPHRAVVTVSNIPQVTEFYSASTTVWGNPWSAAHDEERGECVGTSAPDQCPVDPEDAKPFVTLPRSCTGPLETIFSVDSWQNPGAWTGLPAQSPGLGGCGELLFEPKSLLSQPSTDRAASASGLVAELQIEDEGIDDPAGRALSDLKKVVVALPEGMTANPSVAAGLRVCSEAGLARETLASVPGEGCPEASKIGAIEAESPLLEDELLHGQLYIAEPYANPYGELLALYLVIRDPDLGILVKLPGKVEADPRTGQLLTSFGEAPWEIPQLPVSRLRLQLVTGAGSPLVTPPTCGTHTATWTFTPWADPGNPIAKTSSFQIEAGVGGGPCPPGGTPPFEPGFEAGTLSNDAGTHSSFLMRLTRRDGDQDLTRFAASLPPGLVAKLAGTAQCPDAAIEAAKAKSGKAEQAAPSCPAASRLGSVIAGAGVGSQLTYVPGSIHLAGPYNGAPLSVAAIVPAVAGPFDVGTVVTRVALRIDPRTAKVTVDGAASDPIPHILAGIPLKVRDIRVLVDRPEFTLNPTSCEPFAVGAEIWGGGLDVFGSADDSSILRSQHFQAAGCASLGFRPRLFLKLKGATKRGGHPALIGTYRPRPGQANLRKLVLRLPRSAFLDQAHIRTICTRVQFAANACPPGAVYGHATAHTPLLSEPLSGPVYLRSSDNNLPDFVADLHGLIDVEAVARIDSVKGGIRATFTEVPDAPLTKVVVRMRGARKGLIVNSTDLCARRSRANAGLLAHNAKRHRARPVVVAAGCKGKKGKGARKGKRRRPGASQG